MCQESPSMTGFSCAQTTMNAWSHIRALDPTSSLPNIYWHCLLRTAASAPSTEFYEPGHVSVSFSSTKEGIQKGHWHWDLCLLSRVLSTMCFKMRAEYRVQLLLLYCLDLFQGLNMLSHPWLDSSASAYPASHCGEPELLLPLLWELGACLWIEGICRSATIKHGCLSVLFAFKVP